MKVYSLFTNEINKNDIQIGYNRKRPRDKIAEFDTSIYVLYTTKLVLMFNKVIRPILSNNTFHLCIKKVKMTYF